jgi:hypothetical protein
MEKITLEIIKKEVEKLDPALAGAENDEAYQVAVILLSAAFVEGPNVDRLVKFTGYSRDFIADISRRMHGSGLWENGFVHDDHWFRGDRYATMIFWTDTFVATGQIVVKRSADGQFLYRMRETAPEVERYVM